MNGAPDTSVAAQQAEQAPATQEVPSGWSDGSPQQFKKPILLGVLEGEVFDAGWTNETRAAALTGAVEGADLDESAAVAADPSTGFSPLRQASDSPTVKITKIVNAAAAKPATRQRRHRPSRVRHRIDRSRPSMSQCLDFHHAHFTRLLNTALIWIKPSLAMWDH
jgi:hypothetical protein